MDPIIETYPKHSEISKRDALLCFSPAMLCVLGFRDVRQVLSSADADGITTAATIHATNDTTTFILIPSLSGEFLAISRILLKM
tara:strand:- start:211 stop:462 length:252 start_codon:yes stop_codon:yes gene_type:complete